jgi:Rhodopirellula transposase DDE domain
VHDFADRALGEHAKGIPYGNYGVANDEGWVSAGDVADTAEFAVESIRWWNQMGWARLPDADRLLITADAGGSNGCRLRAWKVQLARLAAEAGLRITVCHYPPGTSKWNRSFLMGPGAPGRLLSPGTRRADDIRAGRRSDHFLERLVLSDVSLFSLSSRQVVGEDPLCAVRRVAARSPMRKPHMPVSRIMRIMTTPTHHEPTSLSGFVSLEALEAMVPVL